LPHKSLASRVSLETEQESLSREGERSVPERVKAFLRGERRVPKRVKAFPERVKAFLRG
jgi:hypothetical protein